MTPPYYGAVVEDILASRREEARLHRERRALLRAARARAEPGPVRRAVGFGLIEVGLRVLTRPTAQRPT